MPRKMCLGQQVTAGSISAFASYASSPLKENKIKLISVLYISKVEESRKHNSQQTINTGATKTTATFW